ncbi:MAG: PD-(D/E)XK nuclease family protein, partial [Magnetococcales bacterium]|nr:PD-(D/E)XK nuclease family protein [Magnetococcales bacterium]
MNDFMRHLQEERAGGAGRAEKRKPSQWMERFGRWLQQLGWPGERPLSSGEYQNRMAWQAVLALLATLDRTAGAMTQSEALQRLQQMAAATPFQPESEEAPVQIMGMLEAVGADFTHLWITGLTAEGWPPPLQANPLLPIGWQRRHGLPFCDAKREWEAARQRLQALLQAADQVVCSYARQEEEQRMTPSPFWQQAAEGDPAWLAAALAESVELDVDRRMHLAARWQWQEEEAPLSYGDGGGMVASGALKAQSLCPFQAYARYRLGARGRSEPGMGLDAAQRGQVVHAALRQLWVAEAEQAAGGEVGQQAPAAARIASAVDVALQQAAELWPEPMHPFFQRLEAARLSRLLAAFVALEQERPLPFAVLGQEVERTLRLGPLTVRVRLDRVDRLSDGSLVVLDYKTGLCRVESWLGERPLDPQLPLYVLAQMQ